MRWHHRLALGASILFLSASAFSAAQEQKAPKWNYYPLQIGNTWAFRVDANGREIQVTTAITDEEKTNGVMTAKLTSPNVKVTENLAQTDAGVFRYRYNGAVVSPAFKLLPYPPTVGATWNGKFSIANEKGDHFYEGKILGEEDVKVPAGDYKKALKVQLNLKEGDHEIDTTYWFVNNVGFVKQVFVVAGSTVVLELESFKKK